MKIKNTNKYEYVISDYELKNIFKSNFIIFDLEATGLDVKNDYITQFGAVVLENGKISKKKFVSYIQSPKKISKFISNLTGITNSNIKNAPTIKEVIKPLWKSYKNYIWVAQCGFEFDFPILKRQLSENGENWFNPLMADTKVMYSYLYSLDKNIPSTNYLLNKYNLNVSKLRRHDALNDSIIVSKILSNILTDYKKHKISNIDIKRKLKIKKFYV